MNSLVVLILLFLGLNGGACKPKSVSFTQGDVPAVERTVKLPKEYTKLEINGSCMVESDECIEYRGLNSKTTATHAKSCKTWKKGRPCSTQNLIGACFDPGAPQTAVFIYRGHAAAVSMSRAKSFCQNAEYFPGS